MDSFRIHPAIGIARVGNSAEYVIAPETMAGSPVPGGGPLTGGLPIRAGTESEPVRSGDLRDAAGALKRQAARFRLFAYPPVKNETWPRNDGVEVVIGSSVGGKIVANIIWTVHLANKKTNHFILAEEGVQGIDSYRGIFPPIRNPSITDPNAPQPPDDEKIAVLGDPARVRQLVIDPGPRAISGANAAPVAFDPATAASHCDAGQATIVALPDYPKSFPADSFENLYQPSGPIDTLGEIVTDGQGRLLVLGGYGKAVGWPIDGNPTLPDDVNNNQWFDDASDGPVSAVIAFDDGSIATAAGAWVTATDPSFAPQILNVVSLWDDLYDCWVRDRAFTLAPHIYDETNGGYQQSYQPTFDDQLAPIFQSAALQQWVVNLNSNGINAHGHVGGIKFGDDPAGTWIAGLGVFRYPNNPSDQNIADPGGGTALMPFHLGDSDSFLTLRQTQLFFLQRWNQGAGNYVSGSTALGPGEYLDKASLVNCLGGRFSPGIDLTFIMREPSIYTLPWQSSGGGPFRITPKALDYAGATSAAPLLGVGYVPQQNVSDQLEPGDLSKFMALPWHTDYNSCATHPPDPNPPANNVPGQRIRIFWSWPAQRPVAVYTAADAAGAPAGPSPGFAQRWSVRGPGTQSPYGEKWGRYQDRIDMLSNWNRIGVIMQAPQIDPQPSPSPDNWYLEVESQLGDSGDPVVPYPNFVGPNPGE